jgi:hypothetical protein
MKKTKQASVFPRKKASASAVNRRARRLTQEEIDERVIAQAGDDFGVGACCARIAKQAAIGLPGNLAQRAAFLARFAP